MQGTFRYEVHSPDAAMTNTPKGGIDFNTDQMRLNVRKQGSGVGINFDPELIKKFESGDFQGFMPIIINIRPITNIASMLGISEANSY